MTIEEAENYYYYEVNEALAKASKSLKKALIIWNIIIPILILVGIILTAIGFTTPPEDILNGHKFYPIGATFEKIYGIVAIWLGIFFILIIDVFYYKNAKKAIKNKQINLLPYTKNLYLNYLRCEDMDPDDKEYYKQQLEDFRTMALTDAMHRSAAAASAAILFSTIYKQ